MLEHSEGSRTESLLAQKFFKALELAFQQSHSRSTRARWIVPQKLGSHSYVPQLKNEASALVRAVGLRSFLYIVNTLSRLRMRRTVTAVTFNRH